MSPSRLSYPPMDLMYFCIRSALSFRIFSVTWPYTSRVKATVAWSRFSDTVLMSSPFSRLIVAKECRRSWKRISGMRAPSLSGTANLKSSVSSIRLTGEKSGRLQKKISGSETWFAGLLQPERLQHPFLKKQRNLKLRNFQKQRLWVGVKAACPVLIYPCDAEQRTVSKTNTA